MSNSIQVYLHPPSPKECKLPSIDSLYDLNEPIKNDQLPIVCLTTDDQTKKLNTLEPQPHLTILTSPSLSSPSSALSPISPLLSPIEHNNLLAPPLPTSSSSSTISASSFRRCRSASSNTSSPTCSPSYSFRSLSEPPTLDLEKEEEEYNPLFGPKRKRGRPPNTSRPESQTTDNAHWTFIKPTVWDVKNKNFELRNQKHQSIRPSFTDNNAISTFTSTNMDMTLSIPKKKRGRKPKKQLAGNSCFVWKDLTAPRGANKKRLLRLEKLAESRTILPATVPIPRLPRQPK
ncbi:hypothetical protein BCV72DRAFT_224554 [Rhizopus microsporus var. microsporus]|uniref:Uncharacterized protein n=2 Tax=Rhizopus microsporus TaxID=58291 RepID=A0A2G4T950_RHIZD|nr:uncharacterized protein RHIMIDRAFT_254219 [Rhizopus microsporus ATCC 52813]ORE08648.1 hypothetical protein BCV72DRAFT_224554 [Rhizopus microsporus var. microsporus]PHZ17539.1 hypothetical protein RHIMIDRAFT_254219 [Rhizopus microsporus ATCC 52813]